MRRERSAALTCAAALFACLGATPQAAEAGTIGFTIKSTVSTEAGVRLQLELRNTGDEAAYDVHPSASVGEASAKGDTKKTIAPQQNGSWSLPLRDQPPQPGSYIVVVRVEYEDANGYPFEVLATAPFSISAAPKPAVRGQLVVPSVQQNGSARGTLTLTVPKDRGNRFEVLFALPGGLRTPQSRQELSVGTDQKIRMPVEIANTTLLPGTSVNVFALVTALDEPTPQTDVVQSIVRVTAPSRIVETNTFIVIVVVLLVYLLALEVIAGLSPRAEVAAWSETRWAAVAELVLILTPTIFLLYNYPWNDLLAETVTAGGDMASHYYPTKLMAEEILPSGQLTGWTMGNYAGFAVFHFYSTLPFALIALLGDFFPMTIVFKLVTLAGPTLLPLAAAYLFRSMNYGRGASALAAASVLPFLMQQGNSMWGGNIPSVLAGEFCHSIGITLSLVFLGMLNRIAQGRGSWPLAGLLLAVIGLCHTFAFMAAVWFSLFFLWPTRDVARTAPPVLAAYVVAFLVLCVWALPIPSRLVFTSEWSMIWRIKDWTEVLPQPLWPAAALSALDVVLMAVRLKPYRAEQQGLLLFMFAGGVVLYFLVPALGFPDIRFVPIGQLAMSLLAADVVYWAAGLTRHRLVLSAVGVAAVLAWAQANLGYIPSWLKWNYSGYEGKNTWAQFKEINDHLRGDLNDPRVVFEHSQTHNRFGSSRAFENLPLFSGRSTLEGVFHQASQNSPFIFYLQSEVSERGSGPFPQYTYTRLKPDKALPHLRLYNVNELVIVSDKARQAYEANPAYKKTFQAGAYAIFEVEGGDTGYVVVPQNEPVLYDGPNWKLAFYRWFKHPELVDVPLVPAEMLREADAREFALRTDAVERLPRRPLERKCNVRSHLEQYRITVDTDCPDVPHIVKVSYFPRWQTEDGSRLVPVSPGFMLLYPRSNHVEIVYKRQLVDWLGLLLSLGGLAIVIACTVNRRWAEAATRQIDRLLHPTLAFIATHRLALTTLLLLLGTGAATATRLTLRAPERAFEKAETAYKNRDFEKAVKLLERWSAKDRDTFKQATALYQLGISHSELGHHAAAITVHERLRFEFPNVDYGAGTVFHLARNYADLGATDSARRYAQILSDQKDATTWVKRLRTERPALFNP